MERPTDPWSELGVAPGASPAEIQHAFRRRLRQHHPDSRRPGIDDAAADLALQRLLAATQALRQRSIDSAPSPARPTVRSHAPADLRATPLRWVPSRQLTVAIEELTATQHELVNLLLDHGHGWSEVGDALNTSAVAAERRYPRRGRRPVETQLT
jgi:hypothetical protein